MPVRETERSGGVTTKTMANASMFKVLEPEGNCNATAEHAVACWIVIAARSANTVPPNELQIDECAAEVGWSGK